MKLIFHEGGHPEDFHDCFCMVVPIKDIDHGLWKIQNLNFTKFNVSEIQETLPCS